MRARADAHAAALVVVHVVSAAVRLLCRAVSDQQKSGAVADMLRDATVATQPAEATSSSSAATNANADTVAAADLPPLSVRFSSQIGAGYLHERFKSSRVGKFMLRYIEFIAFGLLTLAFLIDIIVCAKKSTVDIHLQYNQPQYLAGILALFLTGVILTSQVLWRMYYNRDWRVDWILLAGCLLQWAICCGCGGFLVAMTGSVILVCLFTFLPPVMYLLSYSYVKWKANDFQLWVEKDAAAAKSGSDADNKDESKQKDVTEIVVVPASNVLPSPSGPSGNEQKDNDHAVASPSEADVPAAATTAAKNEHQRPSSSDAATAPKMAIQEVEIDLGKYNRFKKYDICASLIAATLLVIGMGVTICVHNSPAYVGYSIMAAILILCSTIIPIIEWFNSFQISRNMIVMLVSTTSMFGAYLLIFYLQEFRGNNNNSSLALLLLLFLYPTCVVLAFALLKWHDDKWKLTNFVKIALAICCAFIVSKKLHSA